MIKFYFPTAKIRRGDYSDVYFNRARKILIDDNYHPILTLQVFQKQKNITLCGIEETKQLFRQTIDSISQLKIHALKDGHQISSWETVLTIEGDYSYFAHLETVYLGIFARRSLIATNIHNAVVAANGKPVLYFAPRFDYFLNQEGDGYAALIGGASGVSTPAAASLINQKPVGTIPHALIVAYHGDTAKTAIKFNQYFPEINTISLIDFNNNCVKGALESAKKLGKKLWGVRLDTAENIADISTPQQTGVNPLLVKKVRQALDNNGYNWVKIIVSGGFNPEKIKQFELTKTPVDIYAVGSSIFSGKIDFTADAVRLNGKNLAKTGRKYSPNPRLKPWPI
ncbi:MAG: quinolinate phosphoribosyl transferase [Candidatus Beckwithbacteria bacterium]|nr:quinolinate phosphoribosyl transferase [Candidatus Beckwithbacteria bacterium]